ncbi:MAG: hypothetical protein K2Y27_34905 [Xanthobacteraceae bacterium]|nr:hypothetical protein [Xanthobacteraceae bacterium]
MPLQLAHLPLALSFQLAFQPLALNLSCSILRSCFIVGASAAAGGDSMMVPCGLKPVSGSPPNALGRTAARDQSR